MNAVTSIFRTAAIVAGLLALLAGCEPATEQKSTRNAPIASPAPATPTARTDALPTGSGFDFYVLSLSWSPSYCEAEGEDANQQQCAAGRPYAFVVHGLWPQFERGYPEDCATDESQRPEAIRCATLYDIMPSAGLIRYEWKQARHLHQPGAERLFQACCAPRATE